MSNVSVGGLRKTLSLLKPLPVATRTTTRTFSAKTLAINNVEMARLAFLRISYPPVATHFIVLCDLFEPRANASQNQF